MGFAMASHKLNVRLASRRPLDSNTFWIMQEGDRKKLTKNDFEKGFKGMGYNGVC
jgi:hypothetical protein